MDVSKNSGTPKSSILIGFSIIFTIHFRAYFWKHPYVEVWPPQTALIQFCPEARNPLWRRRAVDALFEYAQGFFGGRALTITRSRDAEKDGGKTMKKGGVDSLKSR